MKIAILTTDTSHHRYFINSVSRYFKDIFVVFESRKIKREYKTGPFFQEEQESFNDKFFKDISSEISAPILKNTINCVSTNGPKSISFLNQVKPDICVSFGTGILRKKALQSSRLGTINIHRGIIEKYRGLDSDLWAIFNNDFKSIGTTIHFVDEKLDTGPVISQKRYNLKKEDKIFHIQYHTTIDSTRLVIDALTSINNNSFVSSTEQKNLGKYYTAMPLDKKMIALERFNSYVSSL